MLLPIPQRFHWPLFESLASPRPLLHHRATKVAAPRPRQADIRRQFPKLSARDTPGCAVGRHRGAEYARSHPTAATGRRRTSSAAPEKATAGGAAGLRSATCFVLSHGSRTETVRNACYGFRQSIADSFD